MAQSKERFCRQGLSLRTCFPSKSLMAEPFPLILAVPPINENRGNVLFRPGSLRW